MRTIVAGAFLAAGLAVSTTARADECDVYRRRGDEPSAVACERTYSQRTGVDLAVNVGAGGHINDSSTAFTDQPRAADHLFWPGPAAQLEVGARPLNYLTVGARFAYQFNPQRDLPQGATAGQAHTFSVGVFGRFYLGSALRWRRVDPWASVGVDPYAMVWVRHDTPLGRVEQQIYTVSIPMSLGVDFYLTRRFSLGLQGQIAPWIAWQRCGQNPVTGSACTQENLGTNPYVFAGIQARYVFPVY